mmetsp:Transcript_4020/g.8397  ORF Transcript_4020/g.8397 Transcript_4020/m.8397 type:complete len:121 (-) Transcript_4020:9-371(-)
MLFSPVRTMKNLHKLLSRMSWTQMVNFLRHSPICDHSFLDYVQTRMASKRTGGKSDLGLGRIRHLKRLWQSLWLLRTYRPAMHLPSWTVMAVDSLPGGLVATCACAFTVWRLGRGRGQIL